MTKAKEIETDEIEDDTSDALPPEQEERIVDKVVSKLKEFVKSPVDEKEETDEEIAETVTKEPTTQRGIEEDMTAQVRAAMQKIGAEEEHQHEHEKLKKEIERPPVQVGKVTRFLWGGGES